MLTMHDNWPVFPPGEVRYLLRSWTTLLAIWRVDDGIRGKILNKPKKQGSWANFSTKKGATIIVLPIASTVSKYFIRLRYQMVHYMDSHYCFVNTTAGQDICWFQRYLSTTPAPVVVGSLVVESSWFETGRVSKKNVQFVDVINDRSINSASGYGWVIGSPSSDRRTRTSEWNRTVAL